MIKIWQLCLLHAPDFDNPSDEGRNNSYEVEVSAVVKSKSNLVDANFDTDAQGFIYSDGVLGTSPQFRKWELVQ